MTPRTQSYLSYNWPDKPLGSTYIPGQMSDKNKIGLQIIEFYFHKIDKIKVAGAELSY